MTISSIDAGKTLCNLSGWKITNLRLQKLLYIAHMYYLGRTDKDLIRENFEAWQHGPVEPELYHYCKVYGASSIGHIFPKNGGVTKGDEFEILKETIDAAEGITDAALVSFTHWEKGAWHEVYEKRKRGIAIPRDLIKKEYENRMKRRKHNG
ncbi:MAG: DUF4065 domain-containing protein [Hyphomicrobiales bacterium]|nr:DUF4065 domain-containing protein [Hyphomicrobiales bacterium]MCY4032891.1 DUF4065 domain-containing protein [Hyphomicrobiales bacterium]MCY4039193.1 DUF4065 domain-containing protein [Hyphomicrobiales bacterium]